MLFMHNGQVGGYCAVKRRVEALISDEYYPHRSGTTDSEALFLAALSAGLAEDPIGAISTTLHRVVGLMRDAGVKEALRFTAALTDGANVYAYRWASDGLAPSLYWRQTPRALLVASEPLDGERGRWREVPQACVLAAAPGEGVRILPLEHAMRRAA
jgi:predicted glutamine amidotransferase